MLQLEKKPFVLDGKTYEISCNMAVLEEVEDENGGDFEAVMKLPLRRAAIVFLAAMLNDCAIRRNWHERWTPDELKRRVSLAMLTEADIIGMVTRSLTPQRETQEAVSESNEAEGN